MILIYVITRNETVARNIGRSLIDERLTNSVNIIQGIETMRWDSDAIINTAETILLIKTKALLYSKIENRIKQITKSNEINIFSLPITQIDPLFRDKLIGGVMGV